MRGRGSRGRRSTRSAVLVVTAFGVLFCLYLGFELVQRPARGPLAPWLVLATVPRTDLTGLPGVVYEPGHSWGAPTKLLEFVIGTEGLVRWTTVHRRFLRRQPGKVVLSVDDRDNAILPKVVDIPESAYHTNDLDLGLVLLELAQTAVGGSVVDEDGNPIGGARVTLERRESPLSAWLPAKSPVGPLSRLTRDSGEFRFVSELTAQSLRLEVHCPGYLSITRDLDSIDTQGITLRLSKACSVDANFHFNNDHLYNYCSMEL